MKKLLRRRYVVITLLPVMCLTLVVHSDQPVPGSDMNAAGIIDQDSTAAVGMSGSKIAIDPATGQFRRPTREEARRLAELMRQYLSDKGRYTENRGAVRHANGMISIVVPLSRTNFVTVKRNSDGSFTMGHIRSSDQLAEFVGAELAEKNRPLR